MRIGIDISQMAYENIGVSNILENLIEDLIKIDKKNQYVLFFSSLRRSLPAKIAALKNRNTEIKIFKLPPIVLDLIWNRLHIFPIEWFVGKVDVFITSDWTEPPSRSKKATILYDLVIYKYPEETHNQTQFNFKNLILSPNIVSSQKRKLNWVKKESNVVFCISKSTKKDAEEILGIEKSRLKVIYPSIN